MCLCPNRMIKTQEKGEDRAEFGIFKKKRLEEDKCVSRGHVDGKREEGSVYLSVCWDIVRVGMLRRGEKDKKEKKLLVTPLFPHPSNTPFLLVVWKTLTPPPLLLHTSQSPPTPPSAIVPIPVSLDLLHSPLHMDAAQMTHTSEGCE